MLKKRLIGVVTVKDGWAVQSIGYKRYLPLGKPECLVENLDRWGADEILLQVIDRSVDGLQPDFLLLERIASLGIETPLIYAGGIRTVDDGARAIQTGADRLVLDSILHDDLAVVQGLAHLLGAQALIAALPLSLNGRQVAWMDYRNRRMSAFPIGVSELIETGIVSELLIIDWLHEGYKHGFEHRLVELLPFINIPLIAFGGISDSSQMAELLKMNNVSAVAVGNFLSYREHSIQKLKEDLAALPLRFPHYESKYFSVADT